MLILIDVLIVVIISTENRMAFIKNLQLILKRQFRFVSVERSEGSDHNAFTLGLGIRFHPETFSNNPT